MNWDIWIQLVLIALIMIGGMIVFRHRAMDKLVEYEHRITRLETELGLIPREKITVSKEDAARKQ